MDEESLRARVHVVIEQGKLPSRRPDRTWGGPGVGAPCTICERSVTREQMEFEIEFARTDPPGLDKYHVHTRCFAVWELERQNGGDPRSA